jgi:hypothetical protein
MVVPASGAGAATAQRTFGGRRDSAAQLSLADGGVGAAHLLTPAR